MPATVLERFEEWKLFGPPFKVAKTTPKRVVPHSLAKTFSRNFDIYSSFHKM